MEVEDQQSSEASSPKNYACPHYKRKCKFVTPCCNGVYRCRFCHDEDQNHTLKREDVTMVECSQCGERQGVTEYCRKCNLKFGKYFCYECKLYDDEDKQQFHCKGCGICRVGGRSNYFHCHRCDMCLPNHLQGAHKCVEKVSRSNCPVCQEDIHTSRIPSQIPPCNHLIHKTCFDDMLSNGHYACPVCGISMIPMSEIWKIYDKEIEETPMPDEYMNLFANILCRDCFQSSLSPFHILGIKCGECGSYNTTREKGGLVRKLHGTLVEETFEPGTVGGQPEEGGSPPGSLTPPETPTRDQTDSTSHSAVRRLRGAGGSNLISPLTPEPSPLRENSRSTWSEVAASAAVRRISFSDEPADSPLLPEETMSVATDPPSSSGSSSGVEENSSSPDMI